MRLFTSILFGFALAGCSGNSGGNTPPSPGTQNENQKGNPAQPTPNSPVTPTNPPSTKLQREDITLIKGMIGSTKIADDFLKSASNLKSIKYLNNPKEIFFAECISIQDAISANYKLHSYTEESSNVKIQGIQICPRHYENAYEQIFRGERIDSKSIHYFVDSINVSNQLGLAANRVVTVQYELAGWPVRITRQYLINDSNLLIEYVSSREEAVAINQWSEFHTEIASQSKEGHVLGNVFKLWAKPNEPYYWKRASTFVPSEGNMVTAMRYTQNDGMGREVSETTYTMPFDWHWEAYEVSPVTRTWGIYLHDGKTYGFPESEITFQSYSGIAGICEGGHKGYDSDGNFQRVFGDDNCGKKFDIETVKF
ncbi:MAG: hypothetical protein ACXVCN_18005 [Bdellovibrio sp.]